MTINALFDKDPIPDHQEKRTRGWNRKTTSQFIAEAMNIHGLRYDYGNVDYKGAHTKVPIICRKHGEFLQAPHAHLKGENCPKCANIANGLKKRLSQDEFISRSRDVHGDLYDYSLLSYRSNGKKVEIACARHGSFWQTPSAHMMGHGCRRCGDEYRGSVNREYGRETGWRRLALKKE